MTTSTHGNYRTTLNHDVFWKIGSRLSLFSVRREMLVGSLCSLACLVPSIAAAQFLEDAPVAPGGLTLGDVRHQRFRVGIKVTAEGGPCKSIYATMPLPSSWPEQQVQILSEDLSPNVSTLKYRIVTNGVKQMIVEIPDLAAGDKAHAIITFNLERAAILAPKDTRGYQIPSKTDRSMRIFLGTSPFIETRQPKIVRMAKEATVDLEGWGKVEAIYDVVREKVEYRNGPLKGAARALNDGWGDCEELTCLFIAACRSQGIPARTVWVEGHCYPEFYLVDATGAGWWFPCQAAGTKSFGAMPDQLPILQKGDNFRDPDRPGESLRYMSEFIRGSAVKGAGTPRVEFVREAA